MNSIEATKYLEVEGPCHVLLDHCSHWYNSVRMTVDVNSQYL